MPKRLTVSLPEPIYDYICREAEDQDCSMAELIRRWAIASRGGGEPTTIRRAPNAAREASPQDRDRETGRSKGILAPREPALSEASYFRDSRGSKILNAPGKKTRYETWEQHLEIFGDFKRQNMRTDADRLAHDRWLDETLARRAETYRDLGEVADELPSHLINYQHVCAHGVATLHPCYDCDAERGEADGPPADLLDLGTVPMVPAVADTKN